MTSGRTDIILGHFGGIFGGAKSPMGGQICVNVPQNVVYDTPQAETRSGVQYQKNLIKIF